MNGVNLGLYFFFTLGPFFYYIYSSIMETLLNGFQDGMCSYFDGKENACFFKGAMFFTHFGWVLINCSWNPLFRVLWCTLGPVYELFDVFGSSLCTIFIYLCLIYEPFWYICVQFLSFGFNLWTILKHSGPIYELFSVYCSNFVLFLTFLIWIL